MDGVTGKANTRPSTTLIGESPNQSEQDTRNNPLDDAEGGVTATGNIHLKSVADLAMTEEAKLLLEIIQWKRWRLQRAGIEPKRVYMNFKTKQGLERGIFHKGCVVVVPRGTARVATVCGLDIHEVADLPDGFVDVSGDEEY